MRVALAVLALALIAPTAGAAAVTDTRVVPPRGSGAANFYELNLQALTPGEILEYSWGTRTAGTIDFDVHWHDGQSVRYVVGPEASSTGSAGRLTVPDTSNLSFLWENQATGFGNDVTIAFDVRTVVEDKTLLPAAPSVVAAAAAVLAALAVRRRVGPP